jgi:hypothetical protein
MRRKGEHVIRSAALSRGMRGGNAVHVYSAGVLQESMPRLVALLSTYESMICAVEM